MTDLRDDDALARRFAALRGADARRTPSFERTLADATRPRRAIRRPLVFALAGTAAAAIVAAFWLVQPAAPPVRGPSDPVATALPQEMPTDFLLETASLDATRDAPALNAPVNDEVPFL